MALLQHSTRVCRALYGLLMDRVCGSVQPNCKPGAQPITVTIIDSCPGCSFNIPVPLFSTLADPKWGVIPVSYQQVR